MVGIRWLIQVTMGTLMAFNAEEEEAPSKEPKRQPKHPLPAPPQFYIIIKSLAMFCIFLITLLTLLLLHKGYNIEEKVDPFKRHQSVYAGFVISTMIAFASASSAWLIRNRPQLTALRSCYFILTMVFVASALSTLAYALLLETFRLVTPVIKLWQKEGGTTSLSSSM